MDHTRTRLPLQPLMDKAGCTTARELGNMVGVSRENIQRLKGAGLTIVRADEFATRCGFHASEIWGDDFWNLPEFTDSTVAA